MVLDRLFGGGVVVAVISTAFAVGLLLPPGRLLVALRRWRLAAAMVLLNAVALPGLGWGLARALPLPEAAVTGLALVLVGAGSGAGLKAAQLSRQADLALAVVFTVILQLASILAVPLWSIAVAGRGVSPLLVARNLLVLILLPLLCGLALRARASRVADKWHPGASALATTALAVAIVAGVVRHAPVLRSLVVSWVPVAALLTVALGLVLGAALGGRDAATRTSTSLLSGTRLTSLGLVVITTELGARPAYLGPAIAFALIDLAVPLTLAVLLAHRPVPRAPTADS